MLLVEGVALLFQYLQLGVELASEGIRRDCDKIAQRLGYLALGLGLSRGCARDLYAERARIGPLLYKDVIKDRKAERIRSCHCGLPNGPRTLLRVCTDERD